MIVGIIPLVGLKTDAASYGVPNLTKPAITANYEYDNGYGATVYSGKTSTTVSCTSSLQIKWKDVDADYYNIAVKILDGEPNLGDDEPGTFIEEYQEGYTRNTVSLSLADMKKAAGHWIKVFVCAWFDDGTEYGKSNICHYYFPVAEAVSSTLEEATITVTSVGRTDALKVSWDKITGASGYDIYRSTSSLSSYKLVHTVSSSSTTSWTDSGLKAGTRYYYKIKAFNSKTESGYSNKDSAWTEEEEVEFGVSKTSLSLSWNSTSQNSVTVSCSGAYSADVDYGVPASVQNSGYNYEWLDVTQSGSTLTITPNRANYSAEARTAAVTVTSGSESETITVTQEKCGESKPTITLKRGATVYTNGSDVGAYTIPQEIMEFSVVSSNVRKLTAHLRLDGDNTPLLDTSTYTDKIWLDISNLSAGRYKIDIYASNSTTSNDYWQQSPFDSYTDRKIVLYFTLFEDNSSEAVLSAPTITVSSVGSSNSLMVSWDTVANASGYHIYRSVSSSSSSFQLVHTLSSGSAMSWTDSGLQADTKYYYKVKAYNSSTESDFSNSDSEYTDTGARFDHAPALSLSISGGSLGSGLYGVYYSGDTVYFNCTANYSDHFFVETSSPYLTFYTSEGINKESGTFVEMSSPSVFRNKSYTNGQQFQIFIKVAEGIPAGDYTITVTATDGVYDPAIYGSIPGTSYYGNVKKSLTVRVGAASSGGTITRKSFSSFEDAEKMISYSYSSDWSKIGTIQYVEQYWSGGNDIYYYTDANAQANNRLGGYWTDDSQAKGRCTRAAASMALSYMGITALPKSFNPTQGPYAPFAETLGCSTAGNDLETKGSAYAISLSEFENWYERYANDSTGKYSPIVLHMLYANDGIHAFTVFGRDANNSAYYYVVDSGTGYHIAKVKIVEVNGSIRIGEYIIPNGDSVARYGSDYAMVGVWQYIKNGSDAPTHTHSFTSNYESAHPHKVYTVCSCGEFGGYTGETRKVDGCAECYPASDPAGGNVDLTDDRFERMGDDYKNSAYYQKLKEVVLTGNYADDIVAVAMSQLGYVEASNSQSVYGLFYGNNNTGDFAAWCAHFVDWCAGRAKVPSEIIALCWNANPGVLVPKGEIGLIVSQSTYDANISNWKEQKTDDNLSFPWLSAGKVSRVDLSNYVPKKGDLIFWGSAGSRLSFTHVGIITEDSDGITYSYIDGNGGANGADNVSLQTDFTLKDATIIAYARPNYSGDLPTHTHSYGSVQYKSEHPHAGYQLCSCGDEVATGTTRYDENCTSCNPPESTEIKGDISGDGRIGIVDVLLLFRHSILPNLYPISYTGSVDFTRDGILSIDDALLLLRHSLLPGLYPLVG